MKSRENRIELLTTTGLLKLEGSCPRTIQEHAEASIPATNPSLSCRRHLPYTILLVLSKKVSILHGELVAEDIL